MSLIEDLKTWTAADYRKHGWRVMLTGKLADLGTTWYALTTIPGFIESNVRMVGLYQQYGINGLIAASLIAIFLLTAIVELATELLDDDDYWPITRQMPMLVGYWVAGLVFWLFAINNYLAVKQVQSTLGF